MNYFTIGFGVAALVAVGAIDYVNQANAAGQAPGAYPVSAYFASYGMRISAVREARAEAAEDKARDARRDKGARALLPDAPQGWTRRAWVDGDNGAIEFPKPELSEFDKLTYASSPVLKSHDEKAAQQVENRIDAEAWVYESKGKLVAVRASYDPGTGKDAGSGADTMTSLKDPGWGVVQGVAYGMVPANAAAPDAPAVSRAGTPFRTFEATIGFHDAVRLTVYSNASDAATRAVLAAIDYDDMNSLLSAPLPYIGTHAIAIPPKFEQKLATLMIHIHADLLTRRTKAAQDWMARGETPENAMKLAITDLTHSWGTDGVAQYDMSDAQGAAAGGGGLGGFIKGLFGGGALSQAKAKPDPRAKPQRLKLSGGSSCLEGSAGRFCVK